MGSRNKKSVTRPVAVANSLFNRLFGSNVKIAPSTTTTGTGASVSTIVEAAKLRLGQLMNQNPELTSSQYVMLPNGQVIARPSKSITQNEALERLNDDIYLGRTPNPYEAALATGSIVSEGAQIAAQETLMDTIARDMVAKNSFDAIPVPPQSVLKAAAGLSPNAITGAKDVEIKGKILQSQNNNSGGGGGGGGQYRGTRGYGLALSNVNKSDPVRGKIISAIANASNDADAKSKLQALLSRTTDARERSTIQTAIANIP
jgi:hypothetical protein